jgi:hypothetical protein
MVAANPSLNHGSIGHTAQAGWVSVDHWLSGSCQTFWRRLTRQGCLFSNRKNPQTGDSALAFSSSVATRDNTPNHILISEAGASDWQGLMNAS